MKPFSFFFFCTSSIIDSSLSLSCPSLLPLIPAQYFLPFLLLLPPAEGLTVPPPGRSLAFLFITPGEVILFFGSEGVLILGVDRCEQRLLQGGGGSWAAKHRRIKAEYWSRAQL